jgi:hypothetical protein
MLFGRLREIFFFTWVSRPEQADEVTWRSDQRLITVIITVGLQTCNCFLLTSCQYWPVSHYWQPDQRRDECSQGLRAQDFEEAVRQASETCPVVKFTFLERSKMLKIAEGRYRFPSTDPP